MNLQEKNKMDNVKIASEITKSQANKRFTLEVKWRGFFVKIRLYARYTHKTSKRSRLAIILVKVVSIARKTAPSKIEKTKIHCFLKFCNIQLKCSEFI